MPDSNVLSLPIPKKSTVTMYGAEAEAEALYSYHDTANKAKQLISQNLVDEGFGNWEDALRDVEQYVSPMQYRELKDEFNIFYHSTSNMEEFGDNTDADWPEYQHKSDGTTAFNGNADADTDSSITSGSRAVVPRKLAKRHTMTLREHHHRMPGRSSTISCMEKKGVNSNAHGLLHMPRSDTEVNMVPVHRTRDHGAMVTHEITRVSEPIASSTVSLPDIRASSEAEESVMGSSTHANLPTAPTGLMSSKGNDDWFTKLKITHNFIYGQKREYWPKRPVKVAILDSGFVLNDKLLTEKAMEKIRSYEDKIQSHKTFTNEFPVPRSPQEFNSDALDDLTGHGTTVAYQLMKTCPSAHMYIAKVTVTEYEKENDSPDGKGVPKKKAVPDREAVAKAICHASKSVKDGGWGVDIINMSFGWPDAELPGTKGGISQAISDAKERGVLLFAGASNHGLTLENDVLYPGRDPNVISVDAEDGLGNPAPFAGRSQGGDGGSRYCAPGLSVDSPVSAEPMCGSSFACPVAAGVAALVLEFARHENVSLSHSDTVQRALSNPLGISRVFKAISKESDSFPGFRMLYPWNFFKRRDREEVTRDIVRELELEYGDGKVYHEIKRTIIWEKVIQEVMSSH